MMMKTLAKAASPVLNSPLVLRLRRNHGLEHGTIHMLNRQRFVLSGISTLSGFVLVGDVPTEKVSKAAEEALRRFGRGEAGLAVHPNCGTNLVVTAALMASIGAVGFVGASPRQAWERFSLVLLAMLFAAMFSLPMGLSVQRHFTTTGDMGDLELLGVQRRELRVRGRKIVLHQVKTL
ncbi:MAG: DUF6391 domain-containing protein [Anaerolineae bacterium]